MRKIHVIKFVCRVSGHPLLLSALLRLQQHLKHCAKLKPNTQPCFSSSSLLHTLRKSMALFEITWRRTWDHSLLYVFRYDELFGVCALQISIWFSLYKCTVWRNKVSMHIMFNFLVNIFVFCRDLLNWCTLILKATHIIKLIVDIYEGRSLCLLIAYLCLFCQLWGVSLWACQLFMSAS